VGVDHTHVQLGAGATAGLLIAHWLCVGRCVPYFCLNRAHR
jgi:hypothetical protein